MGARGIELAEAVGASIQTELGIWNGASAAELNRVAWPLVDPDRASLNTDFHLGLRLARLAVTQSPSAPSLQDTLAWAFFANGLYEEAIAASKTALEKASAESQDEYRGYLRRMIQRVEEAKQ